jgi:flagellar assembly protein FliH
MTSLSNVMKGINLLSADDVRLIPIGEIVQKPAVKPEVAALHESNDDTLQAAAAHAIAESILAEAKQSAENLVTEARRMAEQVRQEAHDTGYQAGLEAGLRQGEAEGLRQYAERIALADGIIEDARHSHHEWLERLPKALTEVVMVGLRHLLLRELELAPVDIERHVTDLLQQVAETTAVEIRVHPDDFQAAKESHGTWQSSRFGSWKISIVPDIQIQPGGAEVRSDTGRVDGTMETQLERVHDVLRRVLEQEVHDELGEPLS